MTRPDHYDHAVKDLMALFDKDPENIGPHVYEAWNSPANKTGGALFKYCTRWGLNAGYSSQCGCLTQVANENKHVGYYPLNSRLHITDSIITHIRKLEESIRRQRWFNVDMEDLKKTSWIEFQERYDLPPLEKWLNFFAKWQRTLDAELRIDIEEMEKK